MKPPTIERFALNGAALVPATANPATREIDVQFLSGTPIERVDWDGQPFELVFDANGGDLTRLNSGVAPVLDSHNDRPLSNQLGVVVRAWRQGEKFLARLRFSEREAVVEIWKDLVAGVLRGVSGGFSISEFTDEVGKDGRLTRRTATKWECLEISLVAIPADAGAVTLAFGETSMNTQLQTGAAPAAPQQNDQTEVRRILAAARLGPDFDNRVLEMGFGPDQVRTLAFDEMQRRGSQHDTRIGTSAATVTRDGADTTRLAMQAALLARCTGKAPAEIGRQWHGRRIADMARECLMMRGLRAFGSDSSVISESLMHSTSDFPNLLSGLATKMMLDGYLAAETDLKQAFRRSTAPDFKTKYVLRRGEFPALLQVAEGAQYTQGTVGENKESYAVSTYGRIFSISRQGLVNDDLGAFGDMAASVGSAAADFEANLLVDLITSNSGAGPVMTDTYNLFDNTHHFNSGSGVIGTTALDTARTAMRTQKGIDGATVIDGKPKFLIVAAARQTTAEQVLASITPAQASNVNVFSGQLVLIVEPRLDAKSAARWYLASDPAVLPFAEYSYLAGTEGVQIEQQVGFDIDGLQIKARLDFGAAAIDWRGCYISTGA